MFDWSKVEGYNEGMSSEEKLALLENYEPAAEEEKPVPNKPSVPKAQFDKVSSELATLKKQMRARMSEEEQRESDRLAEQEAIKTELEMLRKEKAVNGHKASFLALGFDETNAQEAAQAMADNEMDVVFTAMKRYKASLEKQLRAEILKDTPMPPNGGDPTDAAKEREETNKLRAAFGLPPI